MAKLATKKKLVLASNSPYRAKILRNIDIEFDQQKSEICERSLERNIKDKNARNIALELAKAKALNLAKNNDIYYLGCDQTLECNNEIFHKANNKEQAIEHIKKLQGKTHYLYSAIALAKNGQIIDNYVGSVALTMKNLSHEQCQNYVNIMGEDILNSVGCYKIEDISISLFDRIEGDYFTIIGLPLLETIKLMQKHQILDAF